MAKKATLPQKKTEIFNIIYLATWVILPLAYFAFKDSVQDPGLYPRHMVLVISTLLCAALLFTKKTKSLPFRLTLAVISFFVLWHFAGYSNAISKTEFWATFGRNGLMLAYLLLTFQLLRNQLLSFSTIIKGVILFAAISALSILPELLKVIFSGKYVEDIYNVRGLFTHKNFAASALLLSVPFLFLGTRNENKAWRLTALITLSIVILEIVLLRTRGVWIGFLAGVGSTVILQLLSKQSAKGQLKAVGIGTGIFTVLILGLFLFGNQTEKILDRGNIDMRFRYWESCVEMVKEQPLTGIGAGNWKINFPKYGLQGTNQSVMEGETNISRPHNDMLWVLSEMGIPAWIALAVFQLFLLFISVKLLNHADGIKRDYAMASIFGLVAFAAYGIGEFPMERTLAVGLLVLLAAEALRLAEEEDILKKPLFTMSATAVNASIVILSVIALWIGNGRISGEKSAKKAVNGYLSQNPRDMLKFGESAQNRFFSLDIYNTPMKYFTGLGHLSQQNFNKAETEFKEALDINPYHINTLRQLGDTYKYQKQYDKAIEQYDKSLAISPQFFYANLNKAEVYLYQNKTIDALKSLNLVSHKVVYPKYQQVGTEVLVRLAKMADDPNYASLQQLARKYANDKAALWSNYLLWKKEIIAAK